MVVPVFWFEFLLDKGRLASHLRQDTADPEPVVLIRQFIQNAEKFKDDNTDDLTERNSRYTKTRALKRLVLQTIGFLSWDLDIVGTLPMPLQHSLMTYINDWEDKIPFLTSVYHRWVLRSCQSPLKRNNPQEDMAAEAILRTLKPEESIVYLNTLITNLSTSTVLVPTLESFVNDKYDEKACYKLPSSHFISIMNFDLGVFYFYKAQLTSALPHFQQLIKFPIEENFPYLKVTKAKLDGYLKGLALIPDNSRIEENDCEMNVSALRMAQYACSGKFNEFFGTMGLPFVESDIITPPMETSDRESESFFMERRLMKSTDMKEVKELLIKLHATSGGNRSFTKLFTSWEIAIPIQNAIVNILPVAFQDYIYILVAKSKQLLGVRSFAHSKDCLEVAHTEINEHLRTISPNLAPYIFNFKKLMKMLEWEMLLVDIYKFFYDWPKQASDIQKRCNECLHCFKLQSSDVNPRAEIIESVVMCLLNLGDFQVVANLEHFQQKWPVLEFLSLISKTCIDIVDLKESSSSYRELWHAILPHFSTSNQVKRQPMKTGILSTRTILKWVLERSKSQLLLQLFVSLFSRLHNHYTDDMGLQIQTEWLNIWPSILDDVTTSSDSKSRVSGASKLNAKHIREVLVQLLQSSVSSEVNWLKCLGDVHLASGNQALAMKSYLEYLALSTDFFEKHSVSPWTDNGLFRRMMKCSEAMQAFTQALILCQFLTEVDYSTAFGMAQEKITTDAGDSLYGFIWDLTILEFLINLHTKRNEFTKRQEAMRIMGLMELNSNNNEEIQREAMHLRKSQFMRTLAKLYIFS